VCVPQPDSWHRPAEVATDRRVGTFQPDDQFIIDEAVRQWRLSIQACIWALKDILNRDFSVTFALWQSQYLNVANSGHFMFSGDLAKLNCYNHLQMLINFYWNSVICLLLNVTLLLQNLVKIRHCLPELWFTFSPDTLYLKIDAAELSNFLGCIECMRCRLYLPMFAVSVCWSVHQSVCLLRCTKWPRLGFTVRRHLVQPMSNYFDHLLTIQTVTKGQSNLAKAASNASNTSNSIYTIDKIFPTSAVGPSGLPSETLCLGSPRVSTQNRTSIRSAVLAQLRVTDRLTDWHTILRDHRSQ